MEFRIKANQGIVSSEEKFIRTTVFVEEQGFMEEFDDIDKKAIHYLGYLGDEAVGCLRVFYDTELDRYTLGRFALLKAYRNQGYGRKLMEAVLQECRKEGIPSLYLHAQKRAVGFYEKVGFTAFGPYEPDEGYPHIWMKTEL